MNLINYIDKISNTLDLGDRVKAIEITNDHTSIFIGDELVVSCMRDKSECDCTEYDKVICNKANKDKCLEYTKTIGKSIKYTIWSCYCDVEKI